MLIFTPGGGGVLRIFTVVCLFVFYIFIYVPGKGQNSWLVGHSKGEGFWVKRYRNGGSETFCIIENSTISPHEYPKNFEVGNLSGRQT